MRATPTPERFALELVSDGGVLLDLESGILIRLNQTASFVWDRALSGMDPRAIEIAFARSFDVSEAIARIDVAEALVLPSPNHAASPPQTECLYELIGDSYRLSVRGVPVLEIAASGRSLRTLDGLTSDELYLHLRSISAKLVALLGGAALHASAVLGPDGRLIAFLGESGAGKTTTARAFARTGLTLTCQDKLVLRRNGDWIVGVLDGEARIDAWLQDVRARLHAVGPERWCETGPLADAECGATAPISTIVLLDKTKRSGTRIDLQPLEAATAAAEIFQHAFYGSSAAHDWRRHLHAAAAMARSATTVAATMPQGVESLVLAARRYTETTQSYRPS